MNPNMPRLLVMSQKARNIFRQVATGVDVPEQDIEDALEYYEGMEFWKDAGGLAERAGMAERAVENYIKADVPARAYRVACKTGLTEIAERVGRSVIISIESLESEQRLREAANLCEEAGLIDRAIQNYESYGAHKNAETLRARGLD